MNEPKSVIITGASSGIGRTLTVAFAEKGWHVTAAARNTDELNVTKKLCDNLTGSCQIVQTDVTDPEQCKNLVEKSLKTTGNLNALINNAGISMRGLFQESHFDTLKQVMNVNFWGAVYCSHYALPYLLKSKGSLVGVSSIAGYRGLPARSGYSASKFALHGLLESVRCENIRSGLHVLIAAPGFVASDIRNRALGPDGNPQKESPLDENKIMPADKVAKLILNAVLKRKKYLILSNQGKLTVWLNKFLPGWLDNIIYNHFKKEPGSPVK